MHKEFLMGNAAIALGAVAVLSPIFTSAIAVTSVSDRILRQEGFIQLDRRRGAVVAIDADKAQAMLKLREKLAILLAKGCCKNIGREDVHALVDEIFDEYRR